MLAFQPKRLVARPLHAATALALVGLVAACRSGASNCAPSGGPSCGPGGGATSGAVTGAGGSTTTGATSGAPTGAATTGTTGTTGTSSTSSASAGGGSSGPPPSLALTPCVPGTGTDYQVGPGPGQIAALKDVPWDHLGPGDTVRIFYASTPYRGHLLVNGAGTPSAPIRVCGVRGPMGERPIIDGKDAVARPGLAYTAAALDNIQEKRAVIMVDRLGTDTWETFPSNIQIDGLAIRGANPAYQFTNSHGQLQNYDPFGGCIWVQRGHGVVIADNEISDCTQAIFTQSTSDGDFAVTRDVRIAGNHMHDAGVAGDEHMHTTYVQSIGVVYELNVYGKMNAGALGNSLKDRSSSVVIRYNRTEDGAHALDLVEPEDYASFALMDPGFHTTLVYGNQIEKDGGLGTVIHYGGDHAGSEANYRKGTLYFFDNSVHLTGTDGQLFQLSTTEEHAEVFNNVFVFDASITYPSMRATQDNAPGYTAGGILNLGVNWISAGWADSDPWHPVPGQLNGSSHMLTGPTPPIDVATMIPLPGSSIVGAAQPPVAAVANVPVSYELQASTGFAPAARPSAKDLGAVEH